MPQPRPTPEPRPYAQRREDTLALLSSPRLDGWLATAAHHPSVTPLRAAWVQESVLMAVPDHLPSARHLREDDRVRIGFGASDDCVVVDARTTDAHPATEMREAHPDLVAAYERQTETPLAEETTVYVFHPRRIMAWRGLHEAAERTLMHDGCWLVQPTSDG